MTSPLALNPLYSDHAVLPREVPLSISGRALPGQLVRVTFAGVPASVRTGMNGVWEVGFEAFPAGGPHTLSVSSSSAQLVRRNIMIGDVWLVAGDAGVKVTVDRSAGGVGALRESDFARLRLFSVTSAGSEHRARECAGRWQVATAQTVPEWSALGCHFGQALLPTVDCCIGIIVASGPDSRLVEWMPGEALHSTLGAMPVFSTPGRILRGSAPAGSGSGEAKQPCRLFNGMIAPLARLRIRGVVWQQGEADVVEAGGYAKAFAGMIHGWREAWQDPRLTFLFVQLPLEANGDAPHAALRAAQATASTLPQTAMVAAAEDEVRNEGDPPEVRIVARRLALAALSLAYGSSQPSEAPRPTSCEVRQGVVQIRFSDTGGVLRLRSDEKGSGFQVAGADRRFVEAKVRIEGDVVKLVHPSGVEPIAVRYGWGSSPSLPLESAAGLPIAPFRTDDWVERSEG